MSIQDETSSQHDTSCEVSNETGKKINIQGTGNRYLMKKAMKTETKNQIKKDVVNHPLNADGYSSENQLEYLGMLINSEKGEKKQTETSDSYLFRYIKRNVEKKMNSYKQQDVQKKRFSPEQFITYSQILEKLNESQLICHYCKEDIFIYYDIVRETKQWTLDRRDNDLGHHYDNVVISCLGCNLKRRRTNQDAFLFTKQFRLVKHE
jgi:hypothetical protein